MNPKTQLIKMAARRLRDQVGQIDETVSGSLNPAVRTDWNGFTEYTSEVHDYAKQLVQLIDEVIL